MMEKEWCPGKKLCKTLNINKVEIYKPVSLGLQPYTKEFFPQYPPGVAEALRDSQLLTAEIEYYTTEHPGVDNLSNDDWHTLHFDRERDASDNVLPLTLPNGVSSYHYEQYCSLKRKLDIANELLAKYPDRPSWKGYELPGSSFERKADNKLLLCSMYRTEDINQLIKQPEAQEKTEQEEDQLTGNAEDHEKLISSVQVSWVNDTTISITWPGEKARQFTCKDLDIKEGAKTWLPFKEVLTSPDQRCHVSTYDIKRDPVKVRLYNAEVKRIDNFSEKFVAFLNREYSASLPAKFNVFENMKGIERAGTYKPKFHVVSGIQKSDNRDPITEMGREEVLGKIETLIKRTKREKDDEKQVSLLAEVAIYAQHARKMKWIDEDQLRSYITLPDKDSLHQDAMSGAEPYDENVLPDGDDSDYSLPPDEQLPF